MTIEIMEYKEIEPQIYSPATPEGRAGNTDTKMHKNIASTTTCYESSSFISIASATFNISSCIVSFPKSCLSVESPNIIIR